MASPPPRPMKMAWKALPPRKSVMIMEVVRVVDQQASLSAFQVNLR